MIRSHVVHVVVCDFCDRDEPMVGRDGEPFYFDDRAEAQIFLEVGVHDWLLDFNGRLACNRCWVFDDSSDGDNDRIVEVTGHGAVAAA